MCTTQRNAFPFGKVKSRWELSRLSSIQMEQYLAVQQMWKIMYLSWETRAEKLFRVYFHYSLAWFYVSHVFKGFNTSHGDYCTIKQISLEKFSMNILK